LPPNTDVIKEDDVSTIKEEHTPSTAKEDAEFMPF